MRISEIFRSIQGEGLYTGTPSVFIRFFGCNFTCSGFGMEKGKLSEERHNIDVSKYEKYEDLPLVHTGCDSYASWDPRFKKFSNDYTAEEVIEKILKIVPEKQRQQTHIIFTGGEPLLKGTQKNIIELLPLLRKNGFLKYTFETNGTQILLNELKDYLDKYTSEVTFSVSSKLYSSSGESSDKAIIPQAIVSYDDMINDYGKPTIIYFKFVVSNEDDIADVEKALEKYETYFSVKRPQIEYSVYLMPAGGTVESYEKNEKNVLELCMKHGYSFSQRLQVPLFKNQWGT